MERLTATAGAASTAGTPLDPAVFREVLGTFASGITVIAATGADGRPAGLACQSFASLSLDPPLVLLCVGRSSTSWPAVREAGDRFGVSILAEEQRAVCEALGRRGGEKFAGVPWEPSPGGAVHIRGALATLDCAVDTVHEAGDHRLVTARVLALTARDDGSPLLYFRSDYATGAFE
ncbi:flavin reductase family protein [Streptomyces virginiae]|uniref:flavin reductase family protein n=1 Tax=Streptomyces virginiae TaxID=1961 RepID=UPI00324381A1